MEATMDAVLYTILAFGTGALGILMFCILWNTTDKFGRVLAFLGAAAIEFWVVMHTIERFDIMIVFVVVYSFSWAYVIYTAE